MQTFEQERERLLAEIMQADEASGLYNDQDNLQDVGSFSDQELIDELCINRGYKVFADNAVARKMAVDFAYEKLSTDDILDRLSDEGIFEYALKYLNPNDVDISDFLPASKNGSNIYKSDAIKLIQELADKNGWDFVYALVEPHEIV